jgi:hypothetical protein
VATVEGGATVGIDRERLAGLTERERGAYAANFPRSRAAFAAAGGHLLGGVPMTWMRMWPGGFPVYQAGASGARVTDVDGGTLLINDETHTFSAGPGGCTAAWGLSPDMVTIGKAIAGGIPAGAYGLSFDLPERILADSTADIVDTGGIGGTLAGAVGADSVRGAVAHYAARGPGGVPVCCCAAAGWGVVRGGGRSRA